ncbi:MAG TPA: hypothetical protein VF753_18435 [Terriglobales bacterium]
MRIRRTFPILIGVLLLAGAIAFIVVLRKHAPPEPARLLPGADGFVYFNLKWARRVHLLDNLPQVSHDPEYQQFIQGTGIDAERDLEEAAFSIHYPPDRSQSQNQETRFSEVLIGHFDSERLNAYLKQNANSVEQYHSTDIYSIPLESRTLRVAILAVDTVAASNVADPLVIKGIVDRSRKLASPFAGPALLRQYYKEVPLASLAWGVVKVNPSTGVSAGPQDWSFLFPRPAVVVASARYLGSVHLRAAAFTNTPDDAAQLSQKLGTFLDLFRTAQITTSASGVDPDVKAVFDSLKVEPRNDGAVVTAVAPIQFFEKLLTSPPQPSPEMQPQPAQPLPPAKSKNKK